MQRRRSFRGWMVRRSDGDARQRKAVAMLIASFVIVIGFQRAAHAAGGWVGGATPPSSPPAASSFQEGRGGAGVGARRPRSTPLAGAGRIGAAARPASASYPPLADAAAPGSRAARKRLDEGRAGRGGDGDARRQPPQGGASDEDGWPAPAPGGRLGGAAALAGDGRDVSSRLQRDVRYPSPIAPPSARGSGCPR